MNLYPTSLHGIEAWAIAHQMRVSEAKFRFAQYGVLQAVADSRALSQVLVFKGGNALDFIWQPNRSTRDLDFSSLDHQLTSERIQALLSPSLDRVSKLLGVLYRVHRMVQQPPGPSRTFITFDGVVGYALPDDRRNRDKIARSENSHAVVPVEISLNEPVCASAEVDIQGTNFLQVCSLEDIVAEKLRALLQQPIRNRTRPQDVLDIAVALHGNPTLDRAQVAEFLLHKASARGITVSRTAFRQEEVRGRAAVDYEGLRETTRTEFVSFEQAYAELLAFIGQLPIPEV